MTMGENITFLRKLVNSQELCCPQERSFISPSQGDGTTVPGPKGLGESTQTWTDSSLPTQAESVFPKG